jgi:hypothetical protein
MTTALFNNSQYVTACDRVLAAGRITKRSGPHTMARSFDYAPQLEERTICVREAARPRAMRAVIATAMFLAIIGGVAGVRISQASTHAPVVSTVSTTR